MSATAAGRGPVIRVLRGSPGPDDLAALVAALYLAAGRHPGDGAAPERGAAPWAGAAHPLPAASWSSRPLPAWRPPDRP